MIRHLKMLTCVLMFHATASTVWAQTPANLPDEDGGMMKWAIAGGLAALICAAGFMNAKRSHMT